MNFLFLLLLGLFFRSSFLFGIKTPFVVGSEIVVNSPLNLKYFKKDYVRIPTTSNTPSNVLIVSIQKDGYAIDTFDPTITFHPGSYEYIKNFSEKLIKIENKKGNTNSLKKVDIYFVAVEYTPKTFGNKKLHIKLAEALEELLKTYVVDNNTKVILLTGGDTANVISLMTKKIGNGKIDSIIYLDPNFKKGNNHDFDKVGKIYNFYTKDKNKIEQFVKDDETASFGKDIVCTNIFTSFVHNGLKNISLNKKFSDKKSNIYMDPFYRVIPKFIYLADTYYKFFKGSLSGVFSKNLYTYLFLKSSIAENFVENQTNLFVDLFDKGKKIFRVSFNNEKEKKKYERQFSWENSTSISNFCNMKEYFYLKKRSLNNTSFLGKLKIIRNVEQKIVIEKCIKKWEEDWKFYPPKESLYPNNYEKIKKIREILKQKFVFSNKSGGEDIIGIDTSSFTKFDFISALTFQGLEDHFINSTYLDFLDFAKKHGNEGFESLIKNSFEWLVFLEESTYSVNIIDELKILRKLVFYVFRGIPLSINTMQAIETKEQMIELAKEICLFCKELKTQL